MTSSEGGTFHEFGSSGTAPSGPVVVEVRNLSKSYGSVSAFEDVNFTIRAGEVVGLVGDNGAGKSTLVKCLSGALTADGGTILMGGGGSGLNSILSARASGIETVYQDLALIEAFDLTDNFYLGREITKAGWRRPFWILDRRAMSNRARTAVGQLPARFPDLDAPIETMSGGQRQIVAMAKAAFWGGRLILLDEPTAALGIKEAQGVLALIAALAEKGDAGVLLIAHNLEHIFAVCTRVLVLRQGQIIADLNTENTDAHSIVAHMTGAI